jgi:hypothetical protein
MATDKSDKSDNFLSEAIKSTKPRFSYWDGFRFGVGFFIAGLLMTLLLSAITWGLVLALRLR